MYHKDIIKQLLPIELGGLFIDDIELEGLQLDKALLSIENLKKEIYPDLVYNLIKEYLRVYSISAQDIDSLQIIREKIIAKINERGGLTKEYYTNLAKKLGYTITIQELRPFMCGWDYGGCEILKYNTIFIYRIYIKNQKEYRFTAGQSTAGERLSYIRPITEIENILKDLKPAHTYIEFRYIGG